MSSLVGLWLGLLTCVMLQTGLFLTIIYTLNWNKVSQKVGSYYTMYNENDLDSSKNSYIVNIKNCNVTLGEISAATRWQSHKLRDHINTQKVWNLNWKILNWNKMMDDLEHY